MRSDAASDLSHFAALTIQCLSSHHITAEQVCGAEKAEPELL